MQSLSDICLNKIENSGADTRELAENELPKQMWTRHPVYKLSCSYDGADYSDESKFFILRNIEVSFTGVYTLKVTITEDDKHIDEKVLEEFCERFGFKNYETTIEDSDHEFSKDESDWLCGKIKWLGNADPVQSDSFFNVLGKGTIVYEIMKIILHDSKIFHAQHSFGGKFQFNFYELDIGDPRQTMYQISDKINLMRHVVYI